LNSTSEAHPEGMGNASGQLGHNLMDHHFRCAEEAQKVLKINTPTVEEPMEFIFQGIKISAMIKEII
jgi:hypothetical protein